MNDLDKIPWKNLTHAYGSAQDVPDLLRALRSAPPDLKDEESPLGQLFGNICHQGTVYDATAYAVPFLLELAADKRTPDRVGVLSLLGAIAEASSDGNNSEEKNVLEASHSGPNDSRLVTRSFTGISAPDQLPKSRWARNSRE